ncbi:MAG: acyltransferase [Acidobacteria bacterium]|nr:acyltransferase [Acidobacteriota bacterium]
MERTNPSGRIGGLDVLRALAIVLVLVAHYPKPGTGLLQRMLNFGWTGVDLFFVLSGYLIGGQLFAALGRGQQISLRSFYLRRFLRTLPNYYLVLSVYALLPGVIGTTPPAPLWKFLSFIQNFGVPSVFTPSWSLCVEEHFYLLFPIIVLLIARSNLPGLALSAFASILIFGVVLRTGIWLSTRPDLLPPAEGLQVFMGSLFFPSYCRLDGITLGVGLAALKHLRPAIWRQAMLHGNHLLAASLVCLLAAVVVLWKRYSLLGAALGFTLMSVSFALLTASVLSERVRLAGFRMPGARYVALLSYSIYLTHSLALDCAAGIAGRLNLTLQSLPGAAIAVLLILLFSNLLYHVVEKPCLSLRDRYFGSTRPTRRLEALCPVPEPQ